MKNLNHKRIIQLSKEGGCTPPPYVDALYSATYLALDAHFSVGNIDTNILYQVVEEERQINNEIKELGLIGCLSESMVVEITSESKFDALDEEQKSLEACIFTQENLVILFEKTHDLYIEEERVEIVVTKANRKYIGEMRLDGFFQYLNSITNPLKFMRKNSTRYGNPTPEGLYLLDKLQSIDYINSLKDSPVRHGEESLNHDQINIIKDNLSGDQGFSFGDCQLQIAMLGYDKRNPLGSDLKEVLARKVIRHLTDSGEIKLKNKAKKIWKVM
ncbi:hypothetical protein DZF79_03045 [Vibrio parahaemolyticus]|nr:hypothetical protein [Vibrio parahaemolyticus]